MDSNNNIENIAISVEKLQEYLNTACLFEDDYFKIFMQNQTYKSAEFMLRTILKNPFLQVKNISVQKVINNIGGREVHLDFYCEQIGENGEVIKRFNIEVQRANEGAIPQRARFYASSLDSASLKEKDKFKTLSENIVIFICENDIFKKGQALYNIQRYIEITDEVGNIIEYKPFEDGSKIIYLNGEYKDTESDLGKIIHDFHCTKSKDMLCDELRQTAEYFKDKKKEEEEMEKLFRFLTDESKEKILKQLNEAESKGKNEGIEIGKRVANMETAKKMISAKIPVKNISEFTGLDEIEIATLATAM